ncbi:MAG: ATP-binding protein, partial [Bacteroidota bacterium]
INIRGQVLATFRLEGSLPELHVKDEVKILRIVQELCNNAHKYAAAEQLNIRLVQEGKKLLLEVVDDGKGIDIELVNNGAQKGFGLKNIALRARELKGKFEIYPGQPKGTRALVTMFENGQ